MRWITTEVTDTEVLLLVNAVELIGDGGRHFLGHDVQTGRKAMTGT
jgi:hypothetical protein